MIRKPIILLVFIGAYSQLAFAQEFLVPVLDGRAVYLQADGSTIFLEQQRAEVHGGHSNLKGFSSPIRLESDRIHEFIVHVDYSVDLKRYLRIFQLKHKSHHTESKSHRYIHLPHHHLDRIESLPFSYERFGESSIKLTLKNKLISGEYAITYGLDEDDVFNLFGVD